MHNYSEIPLTGIQGRFMIIRGGRLTNADLVGLEEFKATLKRGIDVMVISKGGGRDLCFDAS